jgi:hypothetical protein
MQGVNVIQKSWSHQTNHRWLPSSSLGLFCWHVNYDSGDNLPHDQIRCNVTEAKINTVLIKTTLFCQSILKMSCKVLTLSKRVEAIKLHDGGKSSRDVAAYIIYIYTYTCITPVLDILIKLTLI